MTEWPIGDDVGRVSLACALTLLAFDDPTGDLSLPGIPAGKEAPLDEFKAALAHREREQERKTRALTSAWARLKPYMLTLVAWGRRQHGFELLSDRTQYLEQIKREQWYGEVLLPQEWMFVSGGPMLWLSDGKQGFEMYNHITVDRALLEDVFLKIKYQPTYLTEIPNSSRRSPGRPSYMAEIEAEYHRRLGAGEIPIISSKISISIILSDWCKNKYPHDHRTPSANSIRNSLGRIMPSKAK